MVYEADQDAIRDANQQLADAEYNKVVGELQDQIQNLEDARDDLIESYDKQIEKLDDVKNKWSEIVEDIQKASDILKADEVLGAGWQDKVLSGNDQEIYDAFKNMYQTTYNQKESIDKQIESNERIAQMMVQFSEKFTSGAITYQEALDGIKQMSAAMKDGYSAMEQLSGLLDMDDIGSLSQLAGAVDKQVNESVNLLSEYLQQVQDNNETLGSYTSTWDQMQENIANQLEVLEESQDTLEDILDAIEGIDWSSRRDDDDDDDDDEGVHSSGTIIAGSGAVGPGSHPPIPGNSGGPGSDGSRPFDAPDRPGYYSDDDEEDLINDLTYHSGIERGLVGSNGHADLADIIKGFANHEFKEDEVPILARRGEAVLTPAQQQVLVDHVNLPNYFPMPKMTPLSNVKGLSPASFNFNMGDINLPNVTDPDGFARAMQNTFSSTMRQYASKYMK